MLARVDADVKLQMCSFVLVDVEMESFATQTSLVVLHELVHMLPEKSLAF